MQYAVALALLCGVVFFAFWFFRLAFLANFLSRAIMVGFITGLGIEVFTNQVRRMMGAAHPHGAAVTAWAEGLNVPTVEENPDFELLWWVGCSPAYDPRAQQTAKAFAKVLNAAGVNYAVLGEMESCTGDAARRSGKRGGAAAAAGIRASGASLSASRTTRRSLCGTRSCPAPPRSILLLCTHASTRAAGACAVAPACG